MHLHPTVAPGEENKTESDLFMQICYPSPLPSRLPEFQRGGAEAMQSALCFFFTDQIKKRLSDALEQEDWSNSGLPRTERIKKIKQLDKEIAEIEQTISELNADLNEIRKSI